MGALVDRLERWSLLAAEGAGLSWRTDGQRIKAIEIESQSLQQGERFFDWRTPVSASPLFRSIEDSELTGGFFTTLPSITAQACAMLDLIASRICEESLVPVSHHGSKATWQLAVCTFGQDIVPPCFAVLRRSLATLHATHARLETGSGSDCMSAPIGTEDPRFDEAGIVDCAGTATDATCIYRFDIDEDPLSPVFELVEARGQAARKILRGTA